MNTNKLELQQVKTAFMAWMCFLDVVNEVLKWNHFQKVKTPFLVSSGAMESQLDPFITQFQFGSEIKTYQLPTSPEFHLKKALILGLKDVYEIKTCFRNGELSCEHRPEFTMLEFYKNDIKLNDFIHLVADLIINIKDEFFRQDLSKNLFKDLIKSGSLDLNKASFKIVSVKELFSNLNLDLKTDTDVSEIKQMANKVGVNYLQEDDFNEVFFRIWLDKIEPNFDVNTLMVVKDYPPSQSALAAINAEGWADRFEIYWHGLELGNAFYELSESEELKKRWDQENQKRLKESKSPHPIDDYLIVNNKDLPPCCGIAIGLERLFMAMTGYRDIREFSLFENLSV